MNPELFIRTFNFVSQRLANPDITTIFCDGKIPGAEGGSRNEYYLETMLQIALVLLYRMGIPLVNSDDLNFGDFGFVFASFGDVEQNNLDGLMAPHIWKVSVRASNNTTAAQYALQDHREAVKHFESIIRLFGELGYNTSI